MSKLLERLKDQLKEYGKTNDFTNGFKLLEDLTVKEGEFKAELDQLQGRFNSFKKEKIKGTVDQEELRLVENRIREQFLSSVSELQEKDLAIYWSRMDSAPVKRNRVFLVLSAILFGTVLFFAGKMMGISTPGMTTISDTSGIKDSLIVAQRQLEQQIDSLKSVTQEYKDQLDLLTTPDDDSMTERWRAAVVKNRNLKQEITELRKTNNSLGESLEKEKAKPRPAQPNNYYSGITLVVHGSLSEQVRRKLAFAGIYVTVTEFGAGFGRSISYHQKQEKAAKFIDQLMKKNYPSETPIELVENNGLKVSTINLHYNSN